MSRVVVTLSLDERDALVKLAINQLRSPRDQARYILITELQRQGLLTEPADFQSKFKNLEEEKEKKDE
jgi:hypothetical protein